MGDDTDRALSTVGGGHELCRLAMGHWSLDTVESCGHLCGAVSHSDPTLLSPGWNFTPGKGQATEGEGGVRGTFFTHTGVVWVLAWGLGQRERERGREAARATHGLREKGARQGLVSPKSPDPAGPRLWPQVLANAAWLFACFVLFGSVGDGSQVLSWARQVLCTELYPCRRGVFLRG